MGHHGAGDVVDGQVATAHVPDHGYVGRGGLPYAYVVDVAPGNRVRIGIGDRVALHRHAGAVVGPNPDLAGAARGPTASRIHDVAPDCAVLESIYGDAVARGTPHRVALDEGTVQHPRAPIAGGEGYASPPGGIERCDLDAVANDPSSLDALDAGGVVHNAVG